MKIARYWKLARRLVSRPDGKQMDIATWGWSAADPQEAQQRADDALGRLAERISAGAPFPNAYGYGDRPAREEILREIKDDDGETKAMLTRNRYGAVVLNTAELMFIDIDVPEETAGIFDAIRRLFGAGRPTALDSTQQRITEIARSRTDLTIRLYRTFAGFRCAVINKRIKPDGPECDALLKLFGSDPLYIKLCRNQQSFRARLTPKPWRCGMSAPGMFFPFATPEFESWYRKWEADYAKESQPFASCHFIEQFGTDRTSAGFRELIELHDNEARAGSQLPLA